MATAAVWCGGVERCAHVCTRRRRPESFVRHWADDECDGGSQDPPSSHDVVRYLHARYVGDCSLRFGGVDDWLTRFRAVSALAHVSRKDGEVKVAISYVIRQLQRAHL